ncbi:MAG TPA: hypothetical protein VFV76_01910 [Actinomycetes bacterium]|nr:hypothetical protein [Actinomycetes bacterium]
MTLTRVRPVEPVRPGDAPAPGSRRRVVAACVVAALAALLASSAGIPVRATYDAQVAVDETEYVLTALSIFEDGDLDISDELGEARWRSFADVRPPEQTQLLDDGRRLSPHDPLLPLLLAVPTGLFGWVGAKLALALLAAATAALAVWVAVRRFGVPTWLAGAGTAVLAATPPLSVYGQQVYPELPAGLAVLVAVAALMTSTTSARRRAADVVLVAAVVALPWLGVKYLPVAAALALLGLVRAVRNGRRHAAAGMTVALAASGAAYLVVHKLVWGGWTVYASGDHFQSTGEFSVVGVSPDYAGRTVRLLGLLVDREFGLVAWQPAWLLLVPAVAALVRWRLWVLLLPMAAAWATATWLALTMHGYWWPGRQVVVVAPLAVVGLLVWLHRVGRRDGGLRGGGRERARRGALATAAVLGATGLTTYAVLLVQGWRGRLTWVFDVATVPTPTYRLLRPLLPDYRADDVLVPHLIWVTAAIGLACLGWLTAARATRRLPAPVHDHDKEIP